MSMKSTVGRMVLHVYFRVVVIFLRRIQDTYIRTNGLSFMRSKSSKVGHDNHQPATSTPIDVLLLHRDQSRKV